MYGKSMESAWQVYDMEGEDCRKMYQSFEKIVEDHCMGHSDAASSVPCLQLYDEVPMWIAMPAGMTSTLQVTDTCMAAPLKARITM